MTTDRAVRILHVGAIAALLVAGTAVRTWGALIDPLDLWADEAWWATLLESRSLLEHGFRPVGYMWLCRELLQFGSPEVMLRLPSLLAGCAALVFVYRSAELLYRSRVAVLLALALAAFHPHLVVFAKEFKPYSVEVFVYVALTYWALLCLRRGRPTAGFLTAAVAAIPFCYPVVFMYPAIALAFAGEQLAKLRRLTSRERIYFTIGGVAALALLHAFLFEQLDAAASRIFWGAKYDVFPIDTGFAGGLAWYGRKTWALMTLPGALAGIPPQLVAAFGVAYLGGVAALCAARRWRDLALLSAPLVAVACANLFGYWPYGAFRPNLFLVPGAILVIGSGVDWLASRDGWRLAASAIVISVMIAAVRIDVEAWRTKSAAHWSASPQLTEVLEDISRRRREDGVLWEDVLVADWHSWRPIVYYLRRFPGLQDGLRVVRGPLGDLVSLEAQIAREVRRARRERRTTRLWIVVTQLEAHGAIRSSALVGEFDAYRREFAVHDRDYHPVLIELRVQSR